MPSVVRLTLQRSQPSPWGLRLQGGADFEKALMISHVTEGSPSHASGLRSGDVLLEINGAQAGLMTHKAGQEAIISCGDLVPLTVHRQDSQPPAGPQGWTPSVEAVGAPPVRPGVAGETYTKTSLVKPQVEEDHWDVRHNVTAKGFQPGGGAPGFRSVSAPVTRPDQENRGPPPQQPEVTAYLLSRRGPQQSGAPPKMPQGLAGNLARISGGPQQSGAPPPPSDWAQRLDQNTAGSAMNAEDFTKEFMKQLTGGQ